jgi:hypothetical protein
MISVNLEIPEELYNALQCYLNQNKDWDYDRTLTSALSLFLLQNGKTGLPEQNENYRAAARVYLDTLFQEVA